MNTSYLAGHPLQAMRVMAGLPAHGICYSIKHGELKPPNELINNVFQKLQEVHSKLCLQDKKPGIVKFYHYSIIVYINK